MPSQPLETPSGKHAGSENFPVGSWLIAAPLRRHVMVYYNFARAIDDIADSPNLGAEEKLTRLDGFSKILDAHGDINPSGYEKALAMRESLLETGIAVQHCQDLITAFRQDACQHNYDTWDDLIKYCDLSAAPVGRYLIDLHGGPIGDYQASDALCRALQVLNHLQDCGDDYRSLNRVYLPTVWLQEAKAVRKDLALSQSTPALRQVLDKALDATELLIKEARTLPASISDRRLVMETSVIWHIARSLCAKLRHNDPLSHRVVLSKPALLWCVISGLAGSLCHRDKITLP